MPTETKQKQNELNTSQEVDDAALTADVNSDSKTRAAPGAQKRRQVAFASHKTCRYPKLAKSVNVMLTFVPGNYSSETTVAISRNASSRMERNYPTNQPHAYAQWYI